jgi:hypothetical protein
MSSGIASSAAWNASAPSRIVSWSRSSFDEMCAYREPFWTPIAFARSPIDVPW